MDGELKTIPIKETAISFRRFVEEFNIVVIPNTDLSVFTLETVQALTDRFRRISWLGDEPHDSKWIAERAKQIINGVYDYSIDREYTVYQEDAVFNFETFGTRSSEREYTFWYG